jgi:MFS family permease
MSVLAVAVIVAPLVGGFIADNYGYQMIFKVAVVAMLAILVGFLVFDVFFYDDNHPHRKKDKLKSRDLNPFKNIVEFFKIPELRYIGIVGFFANMTVPFGVLLLPTLIVERMGLPNSYLAIAIFVMSFSGIFQYFFGSWVDSWSHRTKYNGKGLGIVSGLLVNVIFLALMYFAPSFEILIAFILLRSIGVSLWSVSAWAFMSDVGEKYNVEGKIIGTYSSISRIAITLSFIGTGYLLVVFSQQVFLIYALLVFLPLPFFAKKLLRKIKPTSWEK